MVPNGWKHQLLGKVISFKNGLNFTKSAKGELIKIVGVGDFKDYSELKDTSLLESIQVANLVRDDELLKSGDLLFVRSNGNKNLIGRCLYFPVVNERLSFSGFTIRGRVDANKILPEYASFLVRSDIVKKQFTKNGGGTNISNLSQQILNDIVFNLPPFQEQKKIAKILSTWDQAITTTEKLLVNSQQQKNALMQNLLTGKVRFPEFSEQWQKIAIGSILKEVKRPVVWNDIDQYKLLSVKRRCEGVFFREVLFGHQILTKKMNIAHAGDFLISKMQVVHGAMGLVGLEHHEFHVSDSYISLEAKNKNLIDLDFFWWFCNQKLMAHKAYLCSYGVHIEKMTFNLGLFLKEKIFIPKSIDEQKKIAQVFITADREIETLQQKLNLLKQEKKALMQQLLTGKRRVKVDES
jgi:type I restriction enzyme S subunit